MTSVELTHPESGQTIEVEKADVEPYVSQGWSEPEKKAPRKKSEQS